MKVAKRLTFLLIIVFSLHQAPAAPLRLAIQNTGEPIQWDMIEPFFEKQNPPLIVISITFPMDKETIAPLFPSPLHTHIPVLLQLELLPGPDWFDDQNLDRLSTLLTAFKNVSHLSLRGWEEINDFNSLAYGIKKVTSLARGIRPGIQIAMACGDWSNDHDLTTMIQTLATNPETSPYFDSFFLDTNRPAKEKIRKMISSKAPHIYFWETVCSLDEQEEKDFEPSRILSCILEHNPLERPHTSLLVIPTNKADILYPPLLRFSEYLMQSLYRDTTTINISYSDGSSLHHPLFFRSTDHTPILFLGGHGGGKVAIALEKGLYRKAFVENLIEGDQAVFKIYRNSTALMLNLKKDFFVVHLIPRRKKVTDSRYNIHVTGTYRLSVEEIIARVRAWKAHQQNQLRAFFATMTTSLRLRIANLRETFDLTVKGPMFAERNKPYDWIWEEFFVNGVKWKSKQVPKIPLLQPEKVNIMPLDINLTEEYRYFLEGETTIEGRRVYAVDFKPRKELKTSSLYRGRIWIDAETFAIHREHLIQLNLKGEVLSNVETRYFKPIPGASEIWLPTLVTGHQVFNTAGRITNVERNIRLSDIHINPENFHTLREQAYQSDFQMVRDSKKGLRYLMKAKKSGVRTVERKTKKSQFFGVLGGFYDSSISYPIPLLGLNYMNFNLGGKGRQVNIFFGGAMLTANYCDPSFMGTKMDLGANLIAFAFPLKNRVYQHDTGTEIEAESLKRWPIRFQVNIGFPLGSYLKFSSFFLFEYNKFSLTKTTCDEFILPRSTLTLSWCPKLTVNVKGFRLTLSGAIFRRGRWQFWGMPGNDYFNTNQRSYIRWRVMLIKDFFFTKFRKLHLTAAYFDGFRLDRFSAYKFGFFNELSMHGYMSGVVQASRAFMLNLSYGFSLAKTFRLEAFYDSAWVTHGYTDYHNTYFSGAAISGTINIPGLSAILRFEVGMPVVNNGIRGLVLYFVLLKMF